MIAVQKDSEFSQECCKKTIYLLMKISTPGRKGQGQPEMWEGQ